MPKPPSRRQPKQLRSQQTVEAVLDAVTRVLKREGAAAVTTNRIAEVAGVSIGSVYQYFPDKHAIFRALRERHVEQMVRVVESTLVARADSDLETKIRGLLDAMIDAHALDPDLYELLLRQARTSGAADAEHEQRLRGALRLAISAHAHEFAAPPEYDRILFVLRQMIEALAHGIVQQPRTALSPSTAKQEATRAVLAYLRDHGWKARKRPHR